MLKDKSVIVTGGSGSQYGNDIVSAFLQSGSKVSILTRNSIRAADRLSCFGDYKDSVHIYETNYSTEHELKFVIDEIASLRGVDVLVNNAATAEIGSVESVDIESWNRVFHLNVNVPMMLSRLVSNYLRNSDVASIVNISSIYGIESPKHFIYGDSGLNSPLNYGASKASLQYITKYLATYWAPKIRVNCVSPGGFYAGQDSDFVSRYEKFVPLGRMAEKNDLGGIVKFLCTDASKYITGQNIVVDGGWTCW